jgi:ankyrin repeat protein
MDQIRDWALNQAVRSGNTTLILHLITMGANVNNKKTIDRDGFNIAPLVIAIRNQDLPTVKCLLKNEATVTEGDLNWAINSVISNTLIANYYGIIKCLIDYGADVNEDGYYTPLDHALLIINQERGLRVAQMLINSGADIHRLNPNNKTVQDRARKANRHTAVNFINKYLELEQEIQSNITQETLTKAVKLGHISSVKTLIEQGYVFNRAHLCTAINNNNITIVKLLLEGDVIPTAKQLKLAKSLDHTEIGRILRAFLGLSGPESFIATTGIRETGTQYALPKEITYTIASFFIL